MLTFDTVVQTEYGSFFKAFAFPGDEKPTTGVAPGSKIEEFNPDTGAVDTYRFNGTAWVKIDANGTPAGGSGSSGGGGALIVHATLTAQIDPPEGHTGAWTPTLSGALDKTAGEIYTAAQTMPVLAILSSAATGGAVIAPLVSSYDPEGGYWFESVSTQVPVSGFSAANEDDYPAAVNDTL